MVNVHKDCEDYCDSSDVHQVAEQAVLAKNALGLAEYAGNNCSSSNGVEVWHDVSSAEILGGSQRQAQQDQSSEETHYPTLSKVALHKAQVKRDPRDHVDTVGEHKTFGAHLQNTQE